MNNQKSPGKSVSSRRILLRHYKLEFLSLTRTTEGRKEAAEFLLNQGKFTPEEIAEVVNNQLPDGQKPWAYTKPVVSKTKKAA